MKRWILAVAATVGLACSLSAEETAADAYGRGLEKEMTERDLDAALSAYRLIVEKHKTEEEYAAKAQFRIGECYEKQGKIKEARKAYGAVIDEYPSQRETVVRAREKLADLGPDGAAEPDPVPAGQKDDAVTRTDKALKSIKISLNFTETPIAETFSFIREVSQLNFVVDAGDEKMEDKTVTIKLQELALDNALALIANVTDTQIVNHHGVLVVTTPERARVLQLRKLPGSDEVLEGGDAAIARKLNGTKLDLDFSASSIYDITDFIQEFTEVNIVLTNRDLDKKADFAVGDATLAVILDLLAFQFGQKIELKNGALVISNDE